MTREIFLILAKLDLCSASYHDMVMIRNQINNLVKRFESDLIIGAIDGKQGTFTGIRGQIEAAEKEKRS